MSKVSKKGIKVIIASGRPHYGIPAIEGKIFPITILLGNGTFLLIKPECFRVKYIDEGLFKRINSYCQKHNIGIFGSLSMVAMSMFILRRWIRFWHR